MPEKEQGNGPVLLAIKLLEQRVDYLEEKIAERASIAQQANELIHKRIDDRATEIKVCDEMLTIHKQSSDKRHFHMMIIVIALALMTGADLVVRAFTFFSGKVP